jgi:multidrug efflux pump subunit AcrB
LDFLPEMDEGSIVLDYESPPGTSLEETDRMLVEKIIHLSSGGYSRRTGTQMGFYYGTIGRIVPRLVILLMRLE